MTNTIFLFILTCCLFFTITKTQAKQNRSFSIDFENDYFLKDGEPFQYISGSVHYFRVVQNRWNDTLYKMKLGGLNAVQMYVEWASHEEVEGMYNFNGNLDLLKFLEFAKQIDLLVILRPGPYIDSERDMGGLPAWLLWKHPNIKLRSSDPDFTREVSKWFGILLHMVKPYLYENGGPIIMIQVENEYGSFACDMSYKLFLRDAIKSIVGPNVILFTTDYAEMDKVKCGSIPEVYPTVDFGTEAKAQVDKHFDVQRTFAPKGPLVNSEFYSGWFDRWGYPHTRIGTEEMASTLDVMLDLGANVNIYIYHGGTSFGLRSGATTDNVTGPGGFRSCVNSYDFDAPMNEAGDPTEKYFAIKKIISKYRNVPAENPAVLAKGNYGRIILSPMVSILDEAILGMFVPRPVQSISPLTFEDLLIKFGFVLYEVTVDFPISDPAVLTALEMKDRAYVYIGKELVGILSRSERVFSLPIFIETGEKLQILVESQGRPSFGDSLEESKGLGSKVTLGSRTLQNWTIYPLGELEVNSFKKFFKKRSLQIKSSKIRDLVIPRKSAMTFTGTFTIGNKTNPSSLDTFVRFDGWRKGIIWINDFLLGRYWPLIGPQQTLYLPSALLNPYPGKNYITLLELESVSKTCTESYQNGCFVEFTDKHVINGTTPY